MMRNRNIPQEVYDGAIKLSTFLSKQFPKYKNVPGNFYSYNDINIINAVIFYSSRNPDLNIKSLPNFFDAIQDLTNGSVNLLYSPWQIFNASLREKKLDNKAKCSANNDPVREIEQGGDTDKVRSLLENSRENNKCNSFHGVCSKQKADKNDESTNLKLCLDHLIERLSLSDYFPPKLKVLANSPSICFDVIYSEIISLCESFSAYLDNIKPLSEELHSREKGARQEVVSKFMLMHMYNIINDNPFLKYFRLSEITPTIFYNLESQIFIDNFMRYQHKCSPDSVGFLLSDSVPSEPALKSFVNARELIRILISLPGQDSVHNQTFFADLINRGDLPQILRIFGSEDLDFFALRQLFDLDFFLSVCDQKKIYLSELSYNQCVELGCMIHSVDCFSDYESLEYSKEKVTMVLTKLVTIVIRYQKDNEIYNANANDVGFFKLFSMVLRRPEHRLSDQIKIIDCHEKFYELMTGSISNGCNFFMPRFDVVLDVVVDLLVMRSYDTSECLEAFNLCLSHAKVFDNYNINQFFSEDFYCVKNLSPNILSGFSEFMKSLWDRSYPLLEEERISSLLSLYRDVSDFTDECVTANKLISTIHQSASNQYLKSSVVDVVDLCVFLNSHLNVKLEDLFDFLVKHIGSEVYILEGFIGHHFFADFFSVWFDSMYSFNTEYLQELSLLDLKKIFDFAYFLWMQHDYLCLFWGGESLKEHLRYLLPDKQSIVTDLKKILKKQILKDVSMLDVFKHIMIYKSLGKDDPLRETHLFATCFIRFADIFLIERNKDSLDVLCEVGGLHGLYDLFYEYFNDNTRYTESFFQRLAGTYNYSCRTGDPFRKIILLSIRSLRFLTLEDEGGDKFEPSDSFFHLYRYIDPKIDKSLICTPPDGLDLWDYIENLCALEHRNISSGTSGERWHGQNYGWHGRVHHIRVFICVHIIAVTSDEFMLRNSLSGYFPIELSNQGQKFISDNYGVIVAISKIAALCHDIGRRHDIGSETIDENNTSEEFFLKLLKEAYDFENDHWFKESVNKLLISMKVNNNLLINSDNGFDVLVTNECNHEQLFNVLSNGFISGKDKKPSLDDVPNIDGRPHGPSYFFALFRESARVLLMAADSMELPRVTFNHHFSLNYSPYDPSNTREVASSDTTKFHYSLINMILNCFWGLMGEHGGLGYEVHGWGLDRSVSKRPFAGCPEIRKIFSSGSMHMSDITSFMCRLSPVLHYIMSQDTSNLLPPLPISSEYLRYILDEASSWEEVDRQAGGKNFFQELSKDMRGLVPKLFLQGLVYISSLNKFLKSNNICGCERYPFSSKSELKDRFLFVNGEGEFDLTEVNKMAELICLTNNEVVGESLLNSFRDRHVLLYHESDLGLDGLPVNDLLKAFFIIRACNNISNYAFFLAPRSIVFFHVLIVRLGEPNLNLSYDFCENIYDEILSVFKGVIYIMEGGNKDKAINCSRILHVAERFTPLDQMSSTYLNENTLGRIIIILLSIEMYQHINGLGLKNFLDRLLKSRVLYNLMITDEIAQHCFFCGIENHPSFNAFKYESKISSYLKRYDPFVAIKMEYECEHGVWRTGFFQHAKSPSGVIFSLILSAMSKNGMLPGIPDLSLLHIDPIYFTLNDILCIHPSPCSTSEINHILVTLRKKKETLREKEDDKYYHLLKVLQDNKKHSHFEWLFVISSLEKVPHYENKLFLSKIKNKIESLVRGDCHKQIKSLGSSSTQASFNKRFISASLNPHVKFRSSSAFSLYENIFDLSWRESLKELLIDEIMGRLNCITPFNDFDGTLISTLWTNTFIYLLKFADPACVVAISRLRSMVSVFIPLDSDLLTRYICFCSGGARNPRRSVNSRLALIANNLNWFTGLVPGEVRHNPSDPYHGHQVKILQNWLAVTGKCPIVTKYNNPDIVNNLSNFLFDVAGWFKTVNNPLQSNFSSKMIELLLKYKLRSISLPWGIVLTCKFDRTARKLAGSLTLDKAKSGIYVRLAKQTLEDYLKCEMSQSPNQHNVLTHGLAIDALYIFLLMLDVTRVHNECNTYGILPHFLDIRCVYRHLRFSLEYVSLLIEMLVNPDRNTIFPDKMYMEKVLEPKIREFLTIAEIKISSYKESEKESALMKNTLGSIRGFFADTAQSLLCNASECGSVTVGYASNVKR